MGTRFNGKNAANNKRRDERRRVDREVAADLKKREKRGGNSTSVPLARGRKPVHSQSRINGQLAKEQKILRNLTHKSGAGGCDPLMTSVIGAITHPFAKIEHVVMPRNTGSTTLTDTQGLLVAHNIYRDLPRGQLYQHDYSTTVTTSVTGHLRIDIPRWGMPWKSNVDVTQTWAPLVSGSAYDGTIWSAALNVCSLDSSFCPSDAPVPTGEAQGAHKVACLGLKITLENQVEAISAQQGTVVMGQNVGVPPTELTATTMPTRWWTTTYDATTTVAQPSVSMLPSGVFYETVDDDAPNLTQMLSLDRCGIVIIGSGMTFGMVINVRIQAAYIHMGDSVPPTNCIMYHTPSFECGVICAGYEQASVTYEEHTGGDPLNSRAAGQARREGQKRGAAVSTLSIPDWLVETGQAVLPALGSMLATAMTL